MKSKNLLFVFPDQLRGQALGYVGREPVITPNIDRFRKSAIDLPHAIANHPVCSPWRGSFFTGMYAHRSGVPSNCTSYSAQFGCELPADALCWSDVLKQRGYSMGYIGKWHLDSPHEPFVDTSNNKPEYAWNEWCPPHRRHGFDYWYANGVYNQHMRTMYWTTDAGRNDFHYVDQWSPEHEVDKAIEYLRNDSGKMRENDKPFALCVSINPPHMPYHLVPAKYLEPYADLSIDDLTKQPNIPPAGTQWGDHYRQNIRNYYAMITGVDEQFGRLLEALDELGLYDDTIVVFTSDHGDCLGIHDCVSKNNHHEESVRVPLLFRIPGLTDKAFATKSDDLLFSTPDFYPTLLDLLGQADAVPEGLEGVNRAPALRGEEADRPTSQYYARAGDMGSPQFSERGIRTHTHTLCVKRTEEDGETVILHDNLADPYQLENVASEQPEVTAALLDELRSWMKKTGDPWESL